MAQSTFKSKYVSNGTRWGVIAFGVLLLFVIAMLIRGNQSLPSSSTTSTRNLSSTPPATQPRIKETETPSRTLGQAVVPLQKDGTRFQALVVEILDGDTIRAKSADGVILIIRLDGIDAPEKGQPFSNVSADALGELVFQKRIDIHIVGQDRYQRTLARLFIDGTSVNSELVRKGMAWHYVKYAASDLELASAEKTARQQQVGLWKDPKPLSPWDWRDGIRPEKGSMATGNPNPNAIAKDVTVYITETGNKYHSKGCRHLHDSAIPIPLSRARSAYEPCKVCKP